MSRKLNEYLELRDKYDVSDSRWRAADISVRSALKEKYKDEEIFVIETSLMPQFIQAGFTKKDYRGDIAKYLFKLGEYIPRYKAEYNPEYKQLIPYIVGRVGDTIFTMVRLKGDARLVGNMSIGIGGHINPIDDIGPKDFIRACMEREITEETTADVKHMINISFEGFIYDPSNSVGQDHLGLLYVVDFDQLFDIKETDTLSGDFLGINQLKDMLKDETKVFENWTRIALENLN